MGKKTFHGTSEPNREIAPNELNLIVKESNSHRGCFYLHNRLSGKSKWLRQDLVAAVLFGRSNPYALKEKASEQKASPVRENHTPPTAPLAKLISTEDPNQPAHEETIAEQRAARIRRARASSNVIFGASNAVAADHFVSRSHADFVLPAEGQPPPAKSMKPPPHVPDTRPMTELTTAQAMMGPIAQALRIPPTRFRPPAGPPKIPTPFTAVSTNQQFYQAFPDHRPPSPCAPPVVPLATGTFDSLTTHKAQFVPHVMDKEKRAKDYENGSVVSSAIAAPGVSELNAAAQEQQQQVQASKAANAALNRFDSVGALMASSQADAAKKPQRAKGVAAWLKKRYRAV